MDEPSDLTKTQRQRADALVIAARILGKRPSPLAGGGGIPEDRSTEDLVDLAQFILQGEHPLAAYREASLHPIIPMEFGPVPVTRDATGRLRAVEDVDLLPSTPGDNPGDDDHGPTQK